MDQNFAFYILQHTVFSNSKGSSQPRILRIQAAFFFLLEAEMLYLRHFACFVLNLHKTAHPECTLGFQFILPLGGAVALISTAFTTCRRVEVDNYLRWKGRKV